MIKKFQSRFKYRSIINVDSKITYSNNTRVFNDSFLLTEFVTTKLFCIFHISENAVYSCLVLTYLSVVKLSLSFI